jgi:NADH-quinone oxidoreductase subunit H
MAFEFNFWMTLLTIAIVMGGLLGLTAYLVLVERKVCAYMQDRVGPNRVGPWGLLQPIADGLKFLFKEEIVPSHVDKWLYLLAPGIAISTSLMAFVVVPFGATEPAPSVRWPQTAEQAALVKAETKTALAQYSDRYQFLIAPHLDVGIVLLFAITSLAVYAVILGGWSSNGKYSLLGGLRSSAQIVSYEIPLGMSVLGLVLLCGSLNLERIINWQVDHSWLLVYQPLAFLLFFTSAMAECNRLPFDLPEAEQELVGGYHTEYGALKLGLFLLGEYTHMITTSFLVSILFLGGWHFPGIATAESGWVVKLLVLGVKMLGFVLLFMLIRWTIPRFRFDQLMGLAWKVLIPLAMLNLVGVMVVKQLDWPPLVLLSVSLLLLFGLGYIVFKQPPRRARPGSVVEMDERYAASGVK